MYLPFKISHSSIIRLGYDEHEEYHHSEIKKDERMKQLRTYLSNSDGVIDGDNLGKLWFPHGKYHVFISHSSKDINMARFLANWLEVNCDLKCFIDADVWLNAYEILAEIDSTHLTKKWVGSELVYNYNERNLSTSHVYSMLSIALMEAIDSIECPIFIESKKSVPLKTSIQDKTLSPWIYEEVNFMNKLRRKEPSRLRDIKYFSAENHTILLEKAFDSLKISHTIPTEGLVRMYSKDVKAMKYLKGTAALDALYKSKFVDVD